MGAIYTDIDQAMREFVERQHVFFVATAPSGDDGHVNCSPKGLDTLRILGARQLAYLDFVGSGAETIAHLRQNARIVVMLCAFEGPPRIVRFHGRGRALEPGDGEFAALLPASRRPRSACARSCGSRSTVSPTRAVTACPACASRASVRSSRLGPSARVARGCVSISEPRTR